MIIIIKFGFFCKLKKKRFVRFFRGITAYRSYHFLVFFIIFIQLPPALTLLDMHYGGTYIGYNGKKDTRFGKTVNLQQLEAALQQIWHEICKPQLDHALI